MKTIYTLLAQSTGVAFIVLFNLASSWLNYIDGPALNPLVALPVAMIVIALPHIINNDVEPEFDRHDMRESVEK